MLKLHFERAQSRYCEFVWPFKNSPQNLSPPNFQFVKRGHAETQQSTSLLLTTSFNHTEINTIACSQFAGKVTRDFRSHGLTVIFNPFDRIYYCLCSSFFSSLNSFNSSRSGCYFYNASGGFTLFDCKVLVLEIILAGFGLQ